MSRAVRGVAGAGCGLEVLGLAGPGGGAGAGAAQAAGRGVIHVVRAAGARANTNRSNNWSGYNIGAAYPGEPPGVETPLVIGTGGTGLAHMPNLGTVHFTRATLNKANPGFQKIDEIQLVTTKGAVVATPSGPGPAHSSFNDCVWKTTCAAPDVPR